MQKQYLTCREAPPVPPYDPTQPITRKATTHRLREHYMSVIVTNGI